MDSGADSERVGQRSLRHTAQRLAGSLLAALLVGGKVEGDEEHQVRRQDTHARESGKLLAGAAASVGHVGEVSRGEVGVRGKVDEAEVDDELDDLETGDPLLPPDADAAGRLEVVPVHDDVDSQVEGDWDPRDGGRANELGVAEESSGAVVVAVEEGCAVLATAMTGCARIKTRDGGTGASGELTERLLLEEEEDGVEELKVLGQVVELRKICQHASRRTSEKRGDLRSRGQPEAESSHHRDRRWRGRCRREQPWEQAAR